MRLVLATRNEGKLAELRPILAEALGHEPELLTALEVGGPEVVEDGVTFEANALKKARALAAHSGLPALADDSGLAVDVLGGSPGVFSAMWSGEYGHDEANANLLLAQLADVPLEHRGAALVCTAALALPDGRTHVERGEFRGRLATAPRGTHGFGYDPVLEVPEPDGSWRSVAELESAEKNARSHRSKAFRALAPFVARIGASGRRGDEPTD